jgi:hypothetical protein
MSSPEWITKRSLSDGGYWLMVQVLFGLLPLWGTILLFALLSKKYELYDLLRNGEFVLYAASFVTGGLYSVRHDIFPLRKVVTMILIVVLLCSSLVFASISVLNIGANPSWLPIDAEVMTHISVGVFLLATVVCAFITVAEAGQGGLNIPDRLRRDRKSLEAGLDSLLDRSHP